MSETTKNAEIPIEQWVIAEQNYMRYTGGALLVIGAVSIFMGVLDNPDDEVVIKLFNGLLTLGLIVGSIWTLWRSTNIEKLREQVADSLERSAELIRAIGIVQGFIGVMFALEGITGNITLLLLALVLFYSAWWAFQRRKRVLAFQEG